MRGTYTATYLERVAATFGSAGKLDSLDVGKGVDRIVGTSTRRIIGCALAAGKNPSPKSSAWYRKHGSRIFSKKLPRGLFGVAPDCLPANLLLEGARNRVAGSACRNAREETVSRGLTNGEVSRLPSRAVEMSQHRSWVFKDPSLRRTNHPLTTRPAQMSASRRARPRFKRSLAAIDQPTRRRAKPVQTFSPTAVFGPITRSCWV